MAETTVAVRRRVRELKTEERKAAKAAARDRERKLRERAELEVRQAQARHESAEVARKMAESDAQVRLGAPVLELRYRNLKITAAPEQHADVLIRTTTITSFRQAWQFCTNDHERVRGAARCAAIGKPAPVGADAPATPELLRAGVDDICRVAIKYGTLTVDPL